MCPAFCLLQNLFWERGGGAFDQRMRFPGVLLPRFFNFTSACLFLRKPELGLA